ncbi:MAG: SAM-dependent methyltransferase [Lachnospiraceae bacterium]|nr:SAM-dependent methyltransferase [Lachnospiraceae bacterium]
MALSLRLQTLCDTVDPCESLCDVGCDHGYVSIELARTGKAKKVLAMDINEGPLKSAVDNINRAGLSDRIETRLSNGLHNIKDRESFDSILIAGMGGRLMTEILTEGIKTVDKAKQLLLQPQSEIFLVREFLRTHGFGIFREICLKDAGKYYFIIDARRDVPVSTSKDSFFFDRYSEYLLDKGDGLYREFLLTGLENNGKYIKQAGNGNIESLTAEKENLERALDLIDRKGN